MSSSTKTSLGLNLWEGKDKPKREDFNNDNRLINSLLTESKLIISDISRPGNLQTEFIKVQI